MGNAASKGRDLMERRERTYTEHRRSGTLAMNLVCVFAGWWLIECARRNALSADEERSSETDRQTNSILADVFRALFEIENQNEPLPT